MSLDEIRAEVVRQRGFIRAAETQGTKILALVDALTADPAPVEPDPGETPVEPEPPAEPEEPVDPLPPSALYPNLPEGYGLIGRNDGSVKEVGSVAFGIDGFSQWFGSNQATAIRVVDDAGNPTGSGKAIEVRWPRDNAGSCRGRWDAVRELYIMHRIVIESGGWDFGHKWFYLFAPGQGASGDGIWSSHERSGALRVIDGRDNEAVDAGNALNARDTELAIEYRFVAESAPHAGDGECYVWINGVLVGSARNVTLCRTSGYTPALNGMEYYCRANSVPTESVFRVREFMIAGR